MCVCVLSIYLFIYFFTFLSRLDPMEFIEKKKKSSFVMKSLGNEGSTKEKK